MTKNLPFAISITNRLRYDVSMSNTLSKSNRYMRDPAMRERLVYRSVASSSAVEGIREPFKDKTAILGKQTWIKLRDTRRPR